MRMRSALFVFMPLATFLAGCPVWGSDGGGSVTNPPVCRTNGDCRTGFYCEDSSEVCVMSPTCTDDGDCSSAQHCDFRDTCVPDVVGGCRTTADCGANQACVEGFCRNATDDSTNEVCQFNYECGGGRLCIDSTCVFPCTSAAQCGSGQLCTDNRCVADPSECNTSNDCSSSEHCVDGRCLEDCRTSNTCTSAQDECNDNDDFCRPDWQPSGFCDGNEDCNQAAGSVCDLTDNVCRVRCGGCGTDADCRPMGAGSATCNMGTGLCEIDSSDIDAVATANEFCQSRDVQLAVCEAGDGYCHTLSEGSVECQTQADCGAGESCTDGQCETP